MGRPETVCDRDAQLCGVAREAFGPAVRRSPAYLRDPYLSVGADDEVVEPETAQVDADRVQRSQLLPRADQDRVVDLLARQLPKRCASDPSA